MATLNKVQLIGYLGKDPELRYTPNGKEVCDISVATTSSWNGSDGQKKEHTEWTTVTCWGQLAINVSQYLQRGSMVYVEGRKQTSVVGEGEDRKYYTKVVASQVTFLDRRNGSSAESSEMTEEIAEADIPF